MTTNEDATTVPTDDDVREAFVSFLKERADAGVLLAIGAEVTFGNGVLTVIFDPAASVPDPDALMSLSPFENHAQFAGTPIAFNNDEGRRLRRAVLRVDTQLTDGSSIGSLTAAEIYKMGTGNELSA